MTWQQSPSHPPQVAPPPGWYFDGNGQRWWDGAAWGPYAPQDGRSDVERGRGIATLSHLASFLGGFILPLIIYLMERNKPDRNRFVMHHVTESLNFQLTCLVTSLGGFVVFALGAFGGMALSGDDAIPVGFLAVWMLMVVLILAGYALGIVGAVQANKGEWWRYPVCIRFVGRGVDWQSA